MPGFSDRSLERLSKAHPELQRLFKEVIKGHDCTVICSIRGEDEQNEAYRTGNSTRKWPNSKHNKTPALAVDVVPYPIDWKNTSAFYYFAGYVKATADRLNIEITWGGDWDDDRDFKDQRLFDLPHWELT